MKIIGGGTGDDGIAGGMALYGARGTGVNGPVRFRPYDGISTNYIVLSCASGDGYFTGTVSYGSLHMISDARLKKNLQKYSAGIAKIKQLPDA